MEKRMRIRDLQELQESRLDEITRKRSERRRKEERIEKFPYYVPERRIYEVKKKGWWHD